MTTVLFSRLQWNNSLFLPSPSLEVWGSAVNCYSEVWGGAPAEIELRAFSLKI